MAVTGYRLYLNGTQVTEVAAGTTAYTFLGLTPATTYTVGVTAVDAATNESSMATIVDTTDAFGITDLAGNQLGTIVRTSAININSDPDEPTTIAYQHLSLSDQDSFLYNVVTATSTLGATVTVEDTTSIEQFGRRVLPLDGIAIDTDDLADYADRQLLIYKDPLNRITGFRVVGKDANSRPGDPQPPTRRPRHHRPRPPRRW